MEIKTREGYVFRLSKEIGKSEVEKVKESIKEVLQKAPYTVSFDAIEFFNTSILRRGILQVLPDGKVRFVRIVEKSLMGNRYGFEEDENFEVKPGTFHESFWKLLDEKQELPNVSEIPKNIISEELDWLDPYLKGYLLEEMRKDYEKNLGKVLVALINSDVKELKRVIEENGYTREAAKMKTEEYLSRTWSVKLKSCIMPVDLKDNEKEEIVGKVEFYSGIGKIFYANGKEKNGKAVIYKIGKDQLEKIVNDLKGDDKLGRIIDKYGISEIRVNVFETNEDGSEITEKSYNIEDINEVFTYNIIAEGEEEYMKGEIAVSVSADVDIQNKKVDLRITLGTAYKDPEVVLMPSDKGYIPIFKSREDIKRLNQLRPVIETYM